ncbi:MAG: tetratricopeptide repeat-containing serine protease family protein [Rivularia sp. (in: cyanobacteria)]|jgi:lipoprotein NlpI
MSTWRWLVVCGCTALLLSSCNNENSRSLNEISEEVKKNTVLVYYQDKKGHGTGFFIEGSQEGCNVLTARHVVPLKTQIKLKTSDQKIWVINDIQRFPNHDLAVINFKSDNSNKCPYKALNVGDSDAIDVLDDIYITGFPGNGLVAQFTSGKVSYVGDSNTDGYGISYTATTAGGMSGGPVINASGKVIAVHGRTDVELSRIAELEGEELPSQEQSTANRNKPGDSVGTFKWGIPIKAYSENVAKVRKQSQQVLDAKDFYNQGNDLYASKDYEKAFEFYDKAVAIKPDYADAWYNRGNALDELKRYEEAVESYDKAIAIKPDYADAWINRGISLRKLKRYEEAIESYDKAIAIKPDYSYAWNNRGYNLEQLKRYKEAIESYDKAIKLNPNYETAINNRKRLLNQLEENSQ